MAAVLVSSLTPTDFICTDPTYRFVDNLDQFSFVGRIKFIAEEPSSDNYSRTGRFNKFEIIENYNASGLGGEVTIISCDGLNTLGCLDYPLTPNQEYIVKTYCSTRNNYESNYLDPMDENSNVDFVLVMPPCSENVLKIEGETAIGNFDDNKYRRKYRTNHFLKKLSFGLVKYKKYESDKLMQTKSLETVERKIKNILNSH